MYCQFQFPLDLWTFNCYQFQTLHHFVPADFHKIGGFFILIPCLNSPHDGVRWRTCQLIGTLTQNNPYCQLNGSRKTCCRSCLKCWKTMTVRKRESRHCMPFHVTNTVFFFSISIWQWIDFFRSDLGMCRSPRCICPLWWILFFIEGTTIINWQAENQGFILVDLFMQWESNLQRFIHTFSLTITQKLILNSWWNRYFMQYGICGAICRPAAERPRLNSRTFTGRLAGPHSQPSSIDRRVP